jgi:hypothetical protein
MNSPVKNTRRSKIQNVNGFAGGHGVRDQSTGTHGALPVAACARPFRVETVNCKVGPPLRLIELPIFHLRDSSFCLRAWSLAHQPPTGSDGLATRHLPRRHASTTVPTTPSTANTNKRTRLQEMPSVDSSISGATWKTARILPWDPVECQTGHVYDVASITRAR